MKDRYFSTFFKELVTQENGLIVFGSDEFKETKDFMFLLLDIYKCKYPNNVYSLEKNIDYKQDIIQLQVNEEAGFGYPEGVKQILRHDPGLVMIDRINDEETAKIVVNAAKRGYFIITSVSIENKVIFDKLCGADIEDKVSKCHILFKKGQGFDQLMLNRFEDTYELLYENNDKFENFKESVEYFDTHIKEQWFLNLLKHFENVREDLITSDRECASFVLTLDFFGLKKEDKHD